MYRSNKLKTELSRCKTISIGNLTTGGTGKTPIAIEFARYFTDIDGYNPCILSRGYGKKTSNKKTVSVARIANKLIANSPDECGDEPFLMANILDNVTILTGNNRKELAKLATDKYACNLLILDDGFQHLRLERDLNLLLIDRIKLTGNNRVLPLGPLREPLSEIKRADAIILVDKNTDCSNIKPLPDEVTNSSIPVFTASMVFDGFENIQTGEKTLSVPFSPVTAFAGIAHPESFFKMVSKHNSHILDTIAFKDHHNYTKNDILHILNISNNNESKALITTQKDAFKIRQFFSLINLPVYTLNIKMEINIPEILEKTGFYDK